MVAPNSSLKSRARKLSARLFTFLFLLGAAATISAGPLENYVTALDTNFTWKKIDQRAVDGSTVTHLELVSQKWREHLWQHHVQIVRPAKVRNPDIAFLLVSGDGDGRSSLELLKLLSSRAGAVAAVVTRVPNQPLYGGRKEDALIAYTFDQYLRTGDATWPLLFPMVKSAVRAMDAVQAFSKEDTKQNIQKFVVGGASKRGWTTWLTAAVDPRVKAISPMVIDTLNMREQAHWAEKVYGKQSEQIRDYTDINLIARIDEPEVIQLLALVDPYSYRERYYMPKLLLLGTNDPYWTVDSLRHYWDALPGPKLIFQTPNAGHNLGGGKEAMQTLAAFFEMVADGKELPQMEWRFEKSPKAGVFVKVNQPAKSVRLWTADSTDRDFRNDKWTSSELEIKPGSAQATGQVEVPEKGYRAFLAEVLLTSPAGHPYKLSTEARVAPDNIR